MNLEFAPLLHERRRLHEGVAYGGTEYLLYNLVVDVSRPNVFTIVAVCRHIVWNDVSSRDRNDKRVFMQNWKSWYLISGSAQTRIWSISLQIA